MDYIACYLKYPHATDLQIVHCEPGSQWAINQLLPSSFSARKTIIMRLDGH